MVGAVLTFGVAYLENFRRFSKIEVSGVAPLRGKSGVLN